MKRASQLINSAYVLPLYLEHVVHHAQQGLARREDVVEAVGRLGAVGQIGALGQLLRKAQHHVQRRAKLVRDAREELGLRRERRLGRPLGGAELAALRH